MSDRHNRKAGHVQLQWGDVAALLALAGLVLVFFWKIAFTGRVLAGLDVFGYFYPYRDYAAEALRAGRLPLWNPYLFMGAPLLANSQVAVLYPLHWPLAWLPVPRQVAWSIIFHVWLAGAGAYLFARRALHLGRPASLLAAVVFGLGGFLGAQVEHLNQLNTSAWLPWLLLCVEGVAAGQGGRRDRWVAVLMGVGVVALALLAGHTQAAYIVFAGAGLYALLRGWPGLRRREWAAGLAGLGGLLMMGLGGGVLAMAQLLPTLELSRLSVRSSGLPYNEAASFSLKPGLIFKAFLPPLLWEAPFSEYVAYVGLIGLALAVAGAWVVIRRRRLRGTLPALAAPAGAALVLALVGVFLAFGAYNPVYFLLYKLVPGFDLFRVPARWLLLYAFGAALLAGVGLEAIGVIAQPSPTPSPSPKGGEPVPSPRGERDRVRGDFRDSKAKQSPADKMGIASLPVVARNDGFLGEVNTNRWGWVLILLLVVELFLVGRRLAYDEPTAPPAWQSMRTATAHLLADDSGEPFRFLSMSDMGYDPGDLADLEAMYSQCLSPQALYNLIVVTKMKEVLAFNLPLRYRIASVDGYDGGLLPVARYVTLEKLFLDEDEIWPDGRLRQQLRRVPEARLLSLLNVKYVITDKTQDVWIDGVYYDLEHTVPLGRLALDDLPAFEADHLGVVSYLTGTAEVTDGTPVARVVITGTAGTVVSRTLHIGEHTAEGRYDDGPVAHSLARVGHRWRDEAGGNDYVALLDLGGPLQPQAIAVESLLPGRAFHLRGMTLVESQSGTNRYLSIDPDYKLVHSGDVKVYENEAVLPRAFAVQTARVVDGDEAALEILRDPAFDPAREVVLDGGRPLEAGGQVAEAEIVSYGAEEVHLQAELDAPGYVVLTDAYYPGWIAEVDGRPADILRADLYFRAVALEAGRHQVVFRYRPAGVRLGLAISLGALVVWLAGAAVLVARRRGSK